MKINEYLIEIIDTHSIIEPSLVFFVPTYHYAVRVDGVHSTAVYAADLLSYAPNYSSRRGHNPCMVAVALRTDPFCNAENDIGLILLLLNRTHCQLTLHSDAMKYGRGL